MGHVEATGPSRWSTRESFRNEVCDVQRLWWVLPGLELYTIFLEEWILWCAGNKILNPQVHSTELVPRQVWTAWGVWIYRVPPKNGYTLGIIIKAVVLLKYISFSKWNRIYRHSVHTFLGGTPCMCGVIKKGRDCMWLQLASEKSANIALEMKWNFTCWLFTRQHN